MDETDKRSGYQIALHTDGLRLRHALQQRRSPGSLLLVTAPGESPGNEFGVKKPLERLSWRLFVIFQIIHLPNYGQTKLNTNPSHTLTHDHLNHI